MATDLGFERLLIQAGKEEIGRLAPTAQTLYLLRGLVVSLIGLALALPLAMFFGELEAAWAMAAVAIIPLIDSFKHRDVERLQREMKFGPYVISNISSETVALLLAVPVALWLESYWAFVVLSGIRAVLGVVLSHVLAESRFTFGWDKVAAQRFLTFGWPLLLNGILMYLFMQGDRYIIGAIGGMAVLGQYFVALQLASVPAGQVGSIMGMLTAPMLAAVKDEPARFGDRATRVIQLNAVMAGTMALVYGFGGAAVVRLIYGAKFHLAGELIPIVAAIFAARMARGGLINSAMARGDTKSSLYSNMFRLCGFGSAVLMAWWGFGVTAVLLALLGGEVIASVVASLRLAWHHKISLSTSGRSGLLVLVGIGLGCVFPIVMGDSTALMQVTVGVMLLAGFVWSALVIQPTVRAELGRVVDGLLKRRQSVMNSGGAGSAGTVVIEESNK